MTHFSSIGALVLGIGPWGDEPTFHAPCFVSTHRPAETIIKKGGTSYIFVTDEIEAVLHRAQEAAGSQDVLVNGGADVARQFLNTGLLDEVRLHLVPVGLSAGTRLFDGVRSDVGLVPREAFSSPSATHLTYDVERGAPMSPVPGARAVLDAASPSGTVLAYTDGDAGYDELLDADGRVPAQWRDQVPPFDPARSRAARGGGALPEFLRSWPEAHRSANPGASVAAAGARAAWLTADHPLDHGYTPDLPLAKLVEIDGEVLMIGAPPDTMTLLHHAEHLARLPGKRVSRYEVPFAAPEVVQWPTLEEFDTADPVIDGLDDDYFAAVVDAFLVTGQGAQGTIDAAPSVLVDAAAITGFAVRWLETRAGSPVAPRPRGGSPSPHCCFPTQRGWWP